MARATIVSIRCRGSLDCRPYVSIVKLVGNMREEGVGRAGCEVVRLSMEVQVYRGKEWTGSGVPL